MNLGAAVLGSPFARGRGANSKETLRQEVRLEAQGSVKMRVQDMMIEGNQAPGKHLAGSSAFGGGAICVHCRSTPTDSARLPWRRPGPLNPKPL